MCYVAIILEALASIQGYFYLQLLTQSNATISPIPPLMEQSPIPAPPLGV